MEQKNCKHPRSYVDSKEKLTRFIYEESHIRNRVSQAVFKQASDNTFSVYRTNNISPEHIWNICDEFVDGERSDGKKSCGRAEILADAFIKNALIFNPNGKPHTRHVDVLGWNPNKPDDLQRRNNLAALAIPYTRPN